MKSYLVLSITCIILAVLITGCTQQTTQIPPTSPPGTIDSGNLPAASTVSADSKLLLTNGIWSLQSIINKGNSVKLVPGTTITANFSAEGNINGNSGCNNYFTSYNVTENKISFGNAGSTMMFCGEPDGNMDQERIYLGILENSSTFSVVANELKIQDMDGKNQLVFAKYNPVILTGSWKLDSMNENNIVNETIKGTNITAIFESDGKVTGSSGCNRYFASFQVEGDKLEISQPGSTRMFCPEPDGVMAQESTYLGNLQNATKYSVKNTELTLLYPNGKATLFYTKI